MKRPLDLDLLRTFVAVVESGSFSDAAPMIGRSQSAVSMQIKRLELSIGRTVLVRGPQAVTPNAVGDELLVYARRLLRLSEEAKAALMGSEEAGLVRLGVPEDYVAQFLPPVLAQFAAEHPLVSVELVCEPSRQLAPAIAAGRIDLAIVTRLSSQTSEALRTEPMVWVTSRSWAAWDAECLPVALFEPGCGPANGNVVQALRTAGLAYRVAYSSASLAGLIAVVASGLAVAGLPRCSVPSSLRIVDGAELPPLRALEIDLLHNPASTTAAARKLRNCLNRELSGRTSVSPEDPRW